MILSIACIPFFQSCLEYECDGTPPELIIENNCEYTLRVDIEVDGYLEYTEYLSVGEISSYRIENDYIKVFTKRAGIVLFPDKENKFFNAYNCRDYFIRAVANPHASNNHELEFEESFN